ncbi:unnamed protein product [Cylicocyclus nassatus]|uniref:Uncharacterized protein n=1 Tax=Cylicocyclus nassatus TaxID=53992 RepID=A0AA36M7E2_CYLNA|nr:unnamed protein product [Cylicocyclus nassatus]
MRILLFTAICVAATKADCSCNGWEPDVSWCGLGDQGISKLEGKDLSVDICDFENWKMKTRKIAVDWGTNTIPPYCPDVLKWYEERKKNLPSCRCNGTTELAWCDLSRRDVGAVNENDGTNKTCNDSCKTDEKALQECICETEVVLKVALEHTLTGTVDFPENTTKYEVYQVKVLNNLIENEMNSHLTWESVLVLLHDTSECTARLGTMPQYIAGRTVNWNETTAVNITSCGLHMLALQKPNIDRVVKTFKNETHPLPCKKILSALPEPQFASGPLNQLISNTLRRINVGTSVLID